jgi:hypothetical protein
MVKLAVAFALLTANAFAYTVMPHSTVVTGNGNTVTAGNTSVQVQEGPNGDTITGDGATITTDGDSDSQNAVNGNNNTVNVENWAETEVNGNGNEVNIDDYGTAEVNGDGNEINHNNEEGGATDANVTGSGNTVNNATSVTQTGPNSFHSQRS